MVKVIFTALTFIVLAFVIVLTFIAVQQDKGSVIVKYDCRMLMGNWHPDVPKTIVEECKKRIKE
jgi:hypothetical protein